MDIIGELNIYFGTEATSIAEFEIDFKDVCYSHDYLESMFKFLRYLERKQSNQDVRCV